MNQTAARNRLTGKKSLEDLLIGNRIPRDYFITSGIGESNITIHAGSYHLALKDAGIEKCNIMVYSSILPGIANEVDKDDATEKLIHGSVLESIMACAHSQKYERATAGIIIGQLHNRKTKERYGGLVAEYSDHGDEKEAENILKDSLDELYENGYSKNFELKDIKYISRSFIPRKKHGTSLVALCFTNYVFPLLNSNGRNGRL